MRIGSSTLELRVESTSSARDARCGLRCVSHRRVGPLSSLTDRVAAVSHRHWTESRVACIDWIGLRWSARPKRPRCWQDASSGHLGGGYVCSRRLTRGASIGHVRSSRTGLCHRARAHRTRCFCVSAAWGLGVGAFESASPPPARTQGRGRRRAGDEAWATPARPSTIAPISRRIATSPAGSAWIASRPRMVRSVPAPSS